MKRRTPLKEIKRTLENSESGRRGLESVTTKGVDLDLYGEDLLFASQYGLNWIDRILPTDHSAGFSGRLPHTRTTDMIRGFGIQARTTFVLSPKSEWYVRCIMFETTHKLWDGLVSLPSRPEDTGGEANAFEVIQGSYKPSCRSIVDISIDEETGKSRAVISKRYSEMFGEHRKNMALLSLQQMIMFSRLNVEKRVIADVQWHLKNKLRTWTKYTTKVFRRLYKTTYKYTPLMTHGQLSYPPLGRDGDIPSMQPDRMVYCIFMIQPAVFSVDSIPVGPKVEMVVHPDDNIVPKEGDKDDSDFSDDDVDIGPRTPSRRKLQRKTWTKLPSAEAVRPMSHTDRARSEAALIEARIAAGMQSAPSGSRYETPTPSERPQTRSQTGRGKVRAMDVVDEEEEEDDVGKLGDDENKVEADPRPVKMSRRDTLELNAFGMAKEYTMMYRPVFTLWFRGMSNKVKVRSSYYRRRYR